MSATPSLPGSSTDGATAEQPLANRPRQPQLTFRLGTHGTILQRLRGRLQSFEVSLGRRPLRQLAARTGDDPTLALLDAWATVADVLTFYQERIANEGYLRTATERFSVTELAQMVGYQPDPGVAAGVCLALTLDETPGMPEVVSVPRGMQVQSLPGQGQLPQAFETIEDFEARADWNKLRPRRSRPQTQLKPAEDMTATLYLQGAQSQLRPGQPLLLISVMEQRAATIQQVSVESGAGRSKLLLKLDPPNVLPEPNQPDTFPKKPAAFEAYCFKQKLGFFGNNAPRKVAGPSDSAKSPPLPPPPPPPPGTKFVTTIKKLDTGDLESTTTATPPVAQSRSPETPAWDTSPKDTIWVDDGNIDWKGSNVYLERPVTEILPGSWALFADGAGTFYSFKIKELVDTSLDEFATVGRSTGLKIDDFSSKTTALSDLKRRTATAYLQSVALPLAEAPVEALGDGMIIELDRLVEGLRANQIVALSGPITDGSPGATGAELATIKSIGGKAGQPTTLTFQQPLRNSYLPSGLVLNANVVRATHGAKVAREVLGSGDVGQRNQRFTLKKPALTYVPSPVSEGAESTLEIRIDDVLWQEVPSLFEMGPRSQCYMLRTDAQGRTTVIFGDGVRGARLPSGQDNVVASYRTGLGPDGEVAAGKIAILQGPPLGVRAATNPLPSSGAAPPESLDEAKDNAPAGALTMGRIVSLRDYQDFVASFAGIGKVRAVPTLLDGRRAVSLTVAAADGGTIDASSELYGSLVGAFSRALDPQQPVEIKSYRPRHFLMDAELIIDPRFLASRVLDDVRAALRSAFSFDRRDFGQPVTAAEVMTIMQGTAGVVAVILKKLAFNGGDAPASPLVNLAAESDQLLLLGDEESDLTLNERRT